MRFAGLNIAAGQNINISAILEDDTMLGEVDLMLDNGKAETKIFSTTVKAKTYKLSHDFTVDKPGKYIIRLRANKRPLRSQRYSIRTRIISLQ